MGIREGLAKEVIPELDPKGLIFGYVETEVREMHSNQRI